MFPLLDKIRKDKAFELDLLIGGAHLLNDYGLTINQIQADGFDTKNVFPFLFTDSLPDVEVRSMAELQNQIGNYFSRKKPDILIVLGDRFELLPVVSACLLMNIPVAHISGGDVTEGAIDNQVRHAISKMSHLHFPATEIYKSNLMKMGEEGWRICVSGEPGLDQILNLDFISKEALFEDLQLKTDTPVICCTFHPDTLNNMISPEFVKVVLNRISTEKNFQILVTAANFDSGGSRINEALQQLSEENKKIRFVKSLGQRRYYSLLKYATLMLGNSSSGLVEAQSFNLPVINVGNRQGGRLANKNVLNVDADIQKIMSQIDEVVSDEFKSVYWNEPNIYGDGNACDRIIEFIKKDYDMASILLKKSVF
jgi:GDP/UDP-N,N'-diacetylbacillosamine 2-epimerase (hydrolysing)